MSTSFNLSKSVWLSLSLALCLFCGVFSGSVTAQQIQWRQDLELAKIEALKNNRLVWLHFSADWCLPCKRLDTFVFSDMSLIRVVDQNTVAVKVDADKSDSLIKAFDVPRIPYDIVMTPGGEVIMNRRSPSRVTDYLKMFNSLDVPLQALNSGERELINARIGKIQKLVQKSGGSAKKTSSLGLDGPSHDMAPTTVEGQRLQRGFESVNRLAETRAAETELLRRKATQVLAQEVQKQSVGSTPKVSINPFFNPGGAEPEIAEISTPSQQKLMVKNDTTSPAIDQFNLLQVDGNNRQETEVPPQMVVNDFVINPKKVVSKKFAQIDPDFLPPMPPSFGQTTTDDDMEVVAKPLSPLSDRQEFSIPNIKPTLDKANVAAAIEDGQIQNDVAGNQFLLPKPPARTLTLPKMSEFTDRLKEKSANNDFIGVPVGDVREKLAIVAKPKPNAVQQKATAGNAVSSPRLASIERPAGLAQRSAAKERMLPKRTIPFPPSKPVVKKTPAMKTTVSVPQPPAVVPGTVEVAQLKMPAVEGHLVVGKPIRKKKTDYPSGNQYAEHLTPQDASQSQRLLQQIDFFETKQRVQPQPKKATVQPQIVINVNTGSANGSQTVQVENHRHVVSPTVGNGQQNATASTSKSSHAKIVRANTAATTKSNYVLQGKCSVTLLTEGRWVDGHQRFGCVHRDRVYLFATAAKRDIFLANPDEMSPLLAGFDPVIFEETGKLVSGEKKFGTFMGEAASRRVVLFKTADTRARFQSEPVKYLNVVRNAMAKSEPKDTKLR